MKKNNDTLNRISINGNVYFNLKQDKMPDLCKYLFDNSISVFRSGDSPDLCTCAATTRDRNSNAIAQRVMDDIKQVRSGTQDIPREPVPVISLLSELVLTHFSYITSMSHAFDVAAQSYCLRVFIKMTPKFNVEHTAFCNLLAESYEPDLLSQLILQFILVG